MAFIVTYTTTKGNVSDPDWNEWLESLDDDYLSNQYPDLAGITPQQYADSFQADVVDVPDDGYVNQEYTYNQDTGVGILVTTWENQTAWETSLKRQHINRPTGFATGNINANTDSPVITGISTKFLLEVDPGDVVNGPHSGNVEVLGTVASVETDTQFTLVANANFNVSDRRYSIGTDSESITPMQWLGAQYINSFTTTTETTYANV